MAHQDDLEASTADPVEDFAKYLEDEPEAEEAPEEEGDEPLEQEEDTQEGDDEPESEEDEAPAIDAPVSWGTDAKEQFAQLPPELQAFVSEREAQRERLVQQKTTEAAEARRNAVIEANQTVAELQQQYAQSLEQYASRFVPQRPDPRLLQQDPVAFYQLQAEYEADVQQRQDAEQRALYARQEAEQRQQMALAQQNEAEMAAIAASVPEWHDETKRAALLTDLANVGVEMGYPSELLGQVDVTDFNALRKASEWRAKAMKWDNAQKANMAKVRSAKTLPKVVKPGITPSNSEVSQGKAQAAWQQAKGAKSKDAQTSAFASYLEASGHL